MNANKLELEVYYGTKAPWSNSTVLTSGDQTLVIDVQFTKTDGKALAEKLKEEGRTVTTIFLTHSHPDHVWGGVEVLKVFPEAKAYARPAVIQEIDLEFRARLLRWTTILDDEIPNELYPIEPLLGYVFDFDGHRIEIIDALPAEATNLTTFYIPEIKTYIAADQAYNRCHYYIAPGLNRPDLWIKSIQSITDNYEIERLIPGHGAVGGPEIFEEAIEYLKFYQEVSKPKVPQKVIADAMLKQYPDWKMQGVLTMSIGPGITAPEILQETGGKTYFGSDSVVKGYYRASLEEV